MASWLRLLRHARVLLAGHLAVLHIGPVTARRRCRGACTGPGPMRTTSRTWARH